MKLCAALSPSEIAHLPTADLTGTTAVVFDILRATTTLTTALHHGAAAIYPAKDIAEAHALYERFPHALLGGERHGEKITGFDLGNSPLEYRDLRDREIISTTTNGTIALRAVVHADCVIAGSLLNLAAIAAYLISHPPSRLLLVCAGTGSEFALEDGFAAGGLIEELEKHLPLELDDAGQMLLGLWQTGSPFEILAGSRNGRRLIERGRRAEVEWCAQVNICRTVGVLTGDAIRPHVA